MGVDGYDATMIEQKLSKDETDKRISYLILVYVRFAHYRP